MRIADGNAGTTPGGDKAAGELRNAEEALAVEFESLGFADLDLLMEWRERVLREVFELSAEEDIDELLAQNRRYYERHLADGGHVAVLARRDGQAVGCGAVCLYDEMPSPDNPTGRCAYLMNIYTVPEMRGCGIAGSVVDWLVGRAREADAGKIYLETTEVARALYARRGFIPTDDFLILA